MEEYEYQRMFDVEQRSWWYRGRRRVLERVLQDLALPAGARIADVGCGTGGNVLLLERFGEVVGVEPSETGAAFARRRTHSEIRVADAYDTTLPDAHFDLVTMFDVLEHLEDDARGLAEVRRILKPGGLFFITVPAFMFLWSSYDETLHHHRRYRRGPLLALLEQQGFAPDWLTYYNTALFAPVASVRVVTKLFKGAKLYERLGWGAVGDGKGGDGDADSADGGDPATMGGPLARVLEGLFAADRHVVGKVRMPFGVSLIGVARG